MHPFDVGDSLVKYAKYVIYALRQRIAQVSPSDVGNEVVQPARHAPGHAGPVDAPYNFIHSPDERVEPFGQFRGEFIPIKCCQRVTYDNQFGRQQIRQGRTHRTKINVIYESVETVPNSPSKGCQIKHIESTIDCIRYRVDALGKSPTDIRPVNIIDKAVEHPRKSVHVLCHNRSDFLPTDHALNALKCPVDAVSDCRSDSFILAISKQFFQAIHERRDPAVDRYFCVARHLRPCSTATATATIVLIRQYFKLVKARQLSF